MHVVVYSGNAAVLIAGRLGQAAQLCGRLQQAWCYRCHEAVYKAVGSASAAPYPGL